ncbi:hypothetical protein [Stenotrophomonas sp. PS02289]|uniref:hypothetical protein n=1 Tax=Stenotrophomonas sp. PS02289 TaxID=2991422 RepID=UPI00249BD34E|nr:hypothetical protein [Stenotrophomonas sp. PS02289]
MKLMRIVLMSIVLLACAAHAGATRYLNLLNRAHDSVMAVDVAEPGSEAFRSRPIDPITGGGGSATVQLGDTGCRFDVRLQFRNGRQVIYRDVDVCRGDTLVIVPLPRTASRNETR